MLWNNRTWYSVWIWPLVESRRPINGAADFLVDPQEASPLGLSWWPRAYKGSNPTRFGTLLLQIIVRVIIVKHTPGENCIRLM